MTVFVDHPQGVDHELCERVTERPPRLPERVRDRRLVAGHEPRLRRRPHFERVVGRTVPVRTADRKRVRGRLVDAGSARSA
jgi:ribosome maturation factor RimP